MRVATGSILALLTSTALASQGDRSPAFQRCLHPCEKACTANSAPSVWQSAFWSPWSCAAHCAYDCTTSLTDLALSFPNFDGSVDANGNAPPLTADLQRLVEPSGDLDGLELGRMVQFYGKWPFRRYFGMQELLSVVFSLANLWAHHTGWMELGRLNRRTSGNGGTLRHYYRLNALVGINTWVWSAVFHTRDTSWTEKADYFSAAASTLYGLWLAVFRSCGLYKDKPARRRAKRLTQVVFGAVFFAHCTYLSQGRFDYGYNMKFNVVIGFAQILLWTIWGLSRFFASSSRLDIATRSLGQTSSAQAPTGRSTHYLGPLLPVWLLFAFTALELLDFAPVPSHWRLLDAHALWHASTVGIVVIWYRFLVRDVHWVTGAEHTGELLIDSNQKRRVHCSLAVLSPLYISLLLTEISMLYTKLTLVALLTCAASAVDAANPNYQPVKTTPYTGIGRYPCSGVGSDCPVFAQSCGVDNYGGFQNTQCCYVDDSADNGSGCGDYGDGGDDGVDDDGTYDCGAGTTQSGPAYVDEDNQKYEGNEPTTSVCAAVGVNFFCGFMRRGSQGKAVQQRREAIKSIIQSEIFHQLYKTFASVPIPPQFFLVLTQRLKLFRQGIVPLYQIVFDLCQEAFQHRQTYRSLIILCQILLGTLDIQLDIQYGSQLDIQCGSQLDLGKLDIQLDIQPDGQCGSQLNIQCGSQLNLGKLDIQLDIQCGSQLDIQCEFLGDQDLKLSVPSILP
ncbi:post-GPI attachment to proteins factor 3, partial [Phenoliferia sp. Uapishka_3]